MNGVFTYLRKFVLLIVALVIVAVISGCSEPEIYTVSFESNGGSIVDSLTLEEGKSFLEPATPTKEGHTFTGWFTDSTLNSSYDFSSSVMGDLILHAKWEIKTMTLSFNYGVDNVMNEPDVVLNFGEVYQLPILDIEGYWFNGWHYGEDNTLISSFTAGETDETVYATLVLKEVVVVVVEDTYEIAMITDSGSIDDESFNQAAWEGIVEFAEANDLTYKYYMPEEVSDGAYLDAIELAVDSGAKIVVLPSWLFETSVYFAQTMYPNVDFVLIDGVPHTPDYVTWNTEDNTLPILFNEHEAGFLAGYAAVMDGYRNLGFIGGMEVPAVVRFGIGYIAGAYYAADQLEVTINFSDDTYYYIGEFYPSNETTILATTWYTNGTEVIFSVAGGANLSVISAASTNNGMVIGADIDQSSDSDYVLTSAMKLISNAVRDALQDYVDGTFTGGETIYKGVLDEGVGLPMDTSRFTDFNQTEYDAIYLLLRNGSVVVPRTYAELVVFLGDAFGYPSEVVVMGNIY